MGARTTEDALKMSDLCRDSGLSKELVHHYLREGLLPPPEHRARYGARHVRLLQLIKRLRDERFLPLPVIRELVELARHDPERIEVVLLSGSEMIATASRRASTRRSGDERFARAEVEARAGASRELVDRCVTLGLVHPTGDRFDLADVNVIALVRRGTALGIPLDSLRTIRSYVELAFELELKRVMPDVGPDPDLEEVAREIAVRKEVVNAFVGNVLGGLIDREISGSIEPTSIEARGLDDGRGRFYQPSDAFLRKHGVLGEIDAVLAKLRARPRDATLLRKLLRLFFLAGRHRELVFAMEHTRVKLADESAVLGYALLRIGQVDRSLEVLERARARRPNDPVVLAYLAAARFHEVGSASRTEVTLPAIQRVATLAEAALGAADTANAAAATEARLMCGWLLSSMPAGSPRVERGLRELWGVHAAASLPAPRDRLAEDGPPGPAAVARLRHWIASACVLYRALGRRDLPAAAAKHATRQRDGLLAELLRLDPASEIALELYMKGSTS